MKVEKFTKAFEKLSDEDKQIVLTKLGITDETDSETEKVESDTKIENKEQSNEEVKESTSNNEPAKEEKVGEKEQVQEESVSDSGQENAGQVEEVGSGETMIALEDIATKDFVRELIASYEAKNKAIEQENQELKDKINDMSNKYEKQDFGNETGTPTLNKQGNTSTYESYDEYIKKFNL